MSLLFLYPFVAAGAGGLFSARSTLAYLADEFTNGNDTIGTLDVLSTGYIDWTGDSGGINGESDWWDPLGTVVGTWHVRLEYSSGTNQYYAIGSDSLNTWIDVSTDPRWRFRKAPSGSSGGTTIGTYLLKYSNDGGSTTHHTTTLTVTLTEETV